jgi:adenylylsulfate kinase
MAEHIYPEFHRMLGRHDKEVLLRQRGVVLWLYGLSGSGKSTIANALERALHTAGRFTQILDGDNMRSGLNGDLGFSMEDRAENVRRVAEVAKLFAHSGVITIVSLICPLRALRLSARTIVGATDFCEVYVHAPFEVCQQRDPKGLYAKVQAGQVARFTGKDSGFEPPLAVDAALTIDTTQLNVAQAVDLLLPLALGER